MKSGFAILIHDWGWLGYNQSDGKRDLIPLSHATDVGYELMTALLVSANNGRPLAPMEMHLKTAEGMLPTRAPAPQESSPLDQVLETMEASRRWNLEKSLLHVIDREADWVRLPAVG